MIHAVLPLKDLAEAKTRLSGVLLPSERRALAMAMVEDVMAVLSAHSEVAAITLVSDDPVAHLLAASFRANWLPEKSLQCRGLNAVIGATIDHLLAAGERHLLVLHGDLPGLSGEDLTAVFGQQRASGGLVIGTDLAGTGTNLLAFDASLRPAFRFGADSCRAHQAWAESAGVPVFVSRQAGIAFDVDGADDLALLLGASASAVGPHTTALLGSWPALRISATLASLVNGEHGIRGSRSG